MIDWIEFYAVPAIFQPGNGGDKQAKATLFIYCANILSLISFYKKLHFFHKNLALSSGNLLQNSRLQRKNTTIKMKETIYKKERIYLESDFKGLESY